MQLGLLTTSYGPHPPEKWARMTAWQICNHLIEDKNPDDGSQEAVSKREARDELQQRLYPVLKAHYKTVQDKERAAIKTHGYDRLTHPLRYSEEHRDQAVAEHIDVDQVVDAVAEEAKLHPELAEHFQKDEVRKMVAEIFRKDASSVMDVERDELANGRILGPDGKMVDNPDHDHKHEHVRAHKKARHPGFTGHRQHGGTV